MMFNIPPVIFETETHLSAEQSRRISAAWEKYCGDIRNGKRPALVLQGGLKAVMPQSAPATVPDAFCRYCGVANLNTSVWCQGCGAPMLRSE